MASTIQNLVKCYCSTCDQYLFSCMNSWTQITKSYYLYSNQSTKAATFSGLLLVPTTVPGTSEMEGCTLRPIRCKGCTALKGGECVEASAEKARYRGRSFIKLAKLTLKSTTTGDMVKANVITTIPKTNPGDHHMQQITDIDRILTSVDWLRAEIIALHAVVAKLQENQVVVEKVHGAQTKESKPGISPPMEEDLKLLTEQVTRVGSKTNEIDGMKLELGSMKRRIEHLEVVNPNHSAHRTPSLPELPNPNSASVQTARRTGPLARGASLIGAPLIAKTPSPPVSIAGIKPPFTAGHDRERRPVVVIPSSQTSDQSDSSGDESHISARIRITSNEKPNEEEFRMEDDNKEGGEVHDSSPKEPGLGTVTNVVDHLQHGKVAHHTTRSTLRGARHSLRKTKLPNQQQELAVLTADGFDDSEDTDYRPRGRSPSSPHERGELSTRGRNRGGRPRKKLRLTTPPWEKPDWNGPEDLQTPKNTGHHLSPVSSRGRNILRRGLSGGLATGSATKRQKMSSQEFTEVGRQRDEEGYLLRWDGQRDRRSLRGRGSLRRRRGLEAAATASHSRSHEKLMGKIFPERRKTVTELGATVKTED